MLFSTNRRRFLQFLTATTGLTLTSPLWVSHSSSFSQDRQLGKLSIGGSPIMITVLLAYLSEQPTIQSLAREVDFSIWKTHDQLRAEVVSSQLH